MMLFELADDFGFHMFGPVVAMIVCACYVHSTIHSDDHPWEMMFFGLLTVIEMDACIVATAASTLRRFSPSSS